MSGSNPDLNLRATPSEPRLVMEALLRDAARCLSCNGCRLSCAIHVPTGRLQPLRLVRLVGAGLQDELVRLPSIWACLQCNRCATVCPISVRPSALARHLREQAVARGLVPPDMVDRHDELLAEFQRVRWHMVAACRAGEEPTEFASQWTHWAALNPSATFIPTSIMPVADHASGPIDTWMGHSSDLSACMSCRECTTACPVAHDPSVFDPATIFRQVNLGLLDDLLDSPSIWLCLGCGGCTSACAQGVNGHGVVAGLQELAIHEGRVPGDFRERLWAFERAVYPAFLAEIGRMLER